MAARTKTETETPEPVAYDSQGNPLTEEQTEAKASGPLVDYVDADFVDPDTGKPAPVSATTDNLQGTVSNTNGRVLVKVAVRGYIGEEPVVLLAENAGEFAELVDGLAKAAAEQKAKFSKTESTDAE
jgi:hypothetical protein